MMQSNKLIRLICLLTVSFLLLLSLCSCSRSKGAATRIVEAPRPNLLLVTLAGWKLPPAPVADGSSTTPTLDKLASEGLVLQDLLATAPQAPPALASIFTGLYPPEHGLRAAELSLAEDTVTLAGILQDSGYRTAAFVADPSLAAATGLDRGFALYDCPASDPGSAAGTDAGRLRYRSFAIPPGADTRSAASVTDAALSWLQSVPPKKSSAKKQEQQPFFTWVHLAETALAYLPPYRRHPRAPAEKPWLDTLANMDAQVARLIAALDSCASGKNTIIAVIGTPGGAPDIENHVRTTLELSAEILQMPSIVQWPEAVSASTSFPSVCSQTVLMPALLKLCNLGKSCPSQLSSRDNAKLLIRGQAAGNEPVYAENIVPYLKFDLPPLQRWWNSQQGFAETNLPPRNTEAYFKIQSGSNRTEYVTLWLQVENRMRNLTVADDRLLEDCQRLVEGRPDFATFQTWLGNVHGLQRRPQEALECHKLAHELDPDSPFRTANLGIACLQTGDLVKAIDHLENAYLAQPGHVGYRDDLASVLLNTGVALTRNESYKDAMACLTRVLYLQPDNPAAHLHLGHLYSKMERTDLARGSYREALNLRPGYIPAQKALKQLSSPEKP